MGNLLDGVSEHMAGYKEDRTFLPSDKKACNVEKVLRESGAEILLNYLPVGSQKATEFYAEMCLKTGISFINCMPVFIVSNPAWAKRFEAKRIPASATISRPRSARPSRTARSRSFLWTAASRSTARTSSILAATPISSICLTVHAWNQKNLQNLGGPEPARYPAR